MTPNERQEMDRETARIQAFKGRVIMLKCACGNEFETDMDSAKAKEHACSRCGSTSWTQKLGRAMVNDPTAPEEMKKRSKKDIKVNGEEE